MSLTVYSSGTGGAPRALSLPAEMFIESARMGREVERLEAGDCWLNCLSMQHVGGVAIGYRCEQAGATMLRHTRFDPQQIAQTLNKGRVTHLSLVPVMLSKLLDYYGDRTAPPQLKSVLIGGDYLSQPLAQRAVAANWPLLVGYGMTETASRVTLLRLESCNIDHWQPGDVGPPLPGIELAIEEQGRVVIESRQLFVESPHRLQTEDGGWLDAEGHLHLLGRLDDKILTGGVLVDPAKVEQKLLQCPGIEQVAVSSRPHPLWGRTVVALVVQPPGEDVLQWCRQRIGSSERPRHWRVVERLPRNSNGKLDRRNLQQMAEEGSPGEEDVA